MGKVVKGTGSFMGDAVPFSKDKQKLFKGALGMNKPKVDTSAQEAALEQQRLDAAKLDEEENRRRKRLFSAASGIRAFSGSPMFRRSAGDSAGSAPGGVPGTAPRGGRAGSPGGRAGGRGTSMIP